MNTYFTLQPEIMKHSRRVFGWFDLLGRLGGITNVMMILFGIFVYPISEHSYILKAAKKLFIARSLDPNLFKEDPRQNIEAKGYNNKIQKELDTHRAIKLHTRDNFCLYLSHRMGCFFPSFCWKKKAKFQKLYSMTQDRMENQLNIIKMVRNVRNLKMISKFSLLTPKLKTQLTHAEKNLIDLDEGLSNTDENSDNPYDSGLEELDISDSEADFPIYSKKKSVGDP